MASGFLGSATRVTPSSGAGFSSATTTTNAPAGFGFSGSATAAPSSTAPFTGYGGFQATPPRPQAPRVPRDLDVSEFGVRDFSREFAQPDPFALREQRVRQSMEPQAEPPEARRKKISQLRRSYLDYIELVPFLDELEQDQSLDSAGIEREFLYAVAQVKRERDTAKQQQVFAEKAAKNEERRFEKFRKERQKQDEKVLLSQRQEAEKLEKKAIDAEKFGIQQQVKLDAETIRAQAKAPPPERAQPTRQAKGAREAQQRQEQQVEIERKITERFGEEFTQSYRDLRQNNPTLAEASLRLRIAKETGDAETEARLKPIVSDLLRMSRLGQEGTAQYKQAMSDLQKTADALGLGRAAISGLTLGLAGRPLDKLIQTVSGEEDFEIGEYQSELGRGAATAVEVATGLGGAGRAIAGASRVLPAAKTTAGAVAQRAGVQAAVGGVQSTANSLNAVARGEMTADEAKANIVSGILSSAVAAPIAAAVPGKLKNAVAQVAGDLMVDLASDAAFTDYLKDEGFVKWFLERELPNLVVSAAGAGLDLKGAYQQKKAIRDLVKDGLTRTINLDKGGGLSREAPAAAPELEITRPAPAPPARTETPPPRVERPAPAPTPTPREAAQQVETEIARQAAAEPTPAKPAFKVGDIIENPQSYTGADRYFVVRKVNSDGTLDLYSPGSNRTMNKVDPEPVKSGGRTVSEWKAADEGTLPNWVKENPQVVSAKGQTAAPAPKVTSVRVGETTFNFRDGEWYREGSTIPVKSTTMLRVINEEASRAIPIRETETIPMGEGAGGRPPVDQRIREQAAPEDQIPQAEVTPPPTEPALPQYLTRRAQLKDEAKQLGLTIREGAPTPEIEATIARAKELKASADAAAAKPEKTAEDFAAIGAEKISRGITGKAWVDEMTSEFGATAAGRDVYGKAVSISKAQGVPKVAQPKPPEGMKERQTVTRAAEGALKEEAVQLRETGEAFREVTPVKTLAETAAKETTENSAQTWKSIQEELDPKIKVSRAVGYLNAQVEKGIDVTKELDELAKVGTDAGTILRAMREINIGTPQGRAKIAADGFIQFAKSKKQQVAPETLAEIRGKFEAAEKLTDESERMAAYKEAVEYSVSKLKLRPKDWIDAYRYTNTLSSPRTHERNIVGNVFNVALNRPLALVGQGDLKGALTYTANAAKSIGEAAEKFKNVFKGVDVPVRATDDMTSASAADDFGKEYQKKIPKVFQYIPKFLEAQDQFFAQIIKGGETQRLLAQGIDPKKAAEQADKLAETYLYRDRIGETERDRSANLFSRAVDGIGLAAQGLRRQENMLGKLADHMIMFVRTPVKIAERGFEFSPLGYVAPGIRKEGGKVWQRDWGMTDEGIAKGKFGKSYSKLNDDQKADVQFWKKERIGRANAGTAITALGGIMAMEGNTTWAEPKDPEEKAAFYDSGRKPYSVKIGDKWVPYITFGPAALAFAIPAAVRDWSSENPNRVSNSTAENIANMAAGLAKFFMTQTPVDGMAKMFQTLTGQIGYDDTKMMETLGFTASQYIPLSSLQRYVNQWIDGEFKKTDGFWDEIKSNVIGQSKDLISYTTMDGEPVKRTTWDLLPPFAIGEAKDEAPLKQRRSELERKNSAQIKATELIKSYKSGDINASELLNFYNALDEDIKESIRRRFQIADPELKKLFGRTTGGGPSFGPGGLSGP